MTVTGTTNISRSLEYTDGQYEEVYPCPCGETHRGPYAIYDYGHHTCAHGPLWLADEGALCSQCGAGFWDVEEKR